MSTTSVRNCYYVTERRPEDAHLKNATNKARADVEATFRSLQMTEIKIDIAFRGENASIGASLKEHRETYGIWKDALSFLQKGDALFVQMPAISHCIYLGRLFSSLRKKGVKVILLIHDLEKLRFVEAEDVPFKTRVRQRLDETSVLKSADLIIAHNPKMAKYLEGEGIPAEKLVSLQIFDYLLPEDFAVHRPYSEVRRRGVDIAAQPAVTDLIVAGNLDSDKVGYLKDIGSVSDIRFQLYGVGYKDDSANAVYNGSFLPDELPAYLHGNFGLVWDGTSVETCAGNYGTYLKYNNPHKLSLYLACGFPVVVWEQSAMAPFVAEHGVGLAVASLRDVGETVSLLTPEKYESMCKNAAVVGQDLRKGTYLTTAVEEALRRVQ